MKVVNTAEYVEGLFKKIRDLEEDRKACWEEFKVQGRRLDKLKAENDLYLGLLCMSKELLTTISRNGSTLRPADWCDNFKAEVADRIQKIDTAISSPENP